MALPSQIPGHPPYTEVKPETMAWDRWFQLLTDAINKVTQVVSPSQQPPDGFTYTITSSRGLCIILPGGPLNSGTIVLPTGMVDGFEQEIMSSQPVAALTIAAQFGESVAGVATFPVTFSQSVMYQFNASTAAWTRIS